jgi:hypothetical protein
LIDNGRPPIVVIDSDVRLTSPGWINIQPGSGITHVINVVGYGEDINPFTLCPTRYLLVRDSLGKEQIHYKIPADNFLEHTLEIHEISKVHEMRDDESATTGPGTAK